MRHLHQSGDLNTALVELFRKFILEFLTVDGQIVLEALDDGVDLVVLDVAANITETILQLFDAALGGNELELLFVALLSAAFFLPQDMRLMGIAAAVIFGFQGLEFWLKSKIRKVKARIIKELPDVVDLLALCVNAGLDFMLSLKWVVEKSQPSAMIDQLNTLLQEINVGKPRRDALRDLARRFDLPDLSTFSRTLIMADKMGTSMSDALNSLSIDMRYARYRRGEAMAMKAPIKLLIPLIFCIFPVVLILVAGPLFLQFMKLDVVQMSQPTKNSQTK